MHMGYVLEEITLKDQERIIADAANDPPTQKELIFGISCGAFPKTWAVDRDRGLCLFLAPRVVREDSWTKPFFFGMNGTLYRIESEGNIGYRMHFSEKRVPVALLHELLDEIKAALVVHGAWGAGPLNKAGKPEFEVNPKFITIEGA
jgi:hypothetical protein